MTSSPLDVRHLNRRFGSIRALVDVSFAVPRAQILGLIGPNGAGKTTLLECLCGLLRAEGGDVLWEGKVLPPQQRRKVMFYLPDSVVPYPQQTVEQVLNFWVRVYGLDLPRLQQVVEVLRLAPVLKRPIVQLSKGWRRRMLLGMGLLTPHPLLLIDEPFDGLDLRHTHEMMTVLRDAASQGRTLVLSIHQLVEAQRVCDSFVLLSEGRVAGQGTLSELRDLAKIELAQLEDVFLALT